MMGFFCIKYWAPVSLLAFFFTKDLCMNKTLSRPQLVPVYCVGAGMKSTQFQFNDLDIIRTLKRDISFLAQPMHNLSIIGTILSIYWQ